MKQIFLIQFITPICVFQVLGKEDGRFYCRGSAERIDVVLTVYLTLAIFWPASQTEVLVSSQLLSWSHRDKNSAGLSAPILSTFPMSIRHTLSLAETYVQNECQHFISTCSSKQRCETRVHLSSVRSLVQVWGGRRREQLYWQPLSFLSFINSDSFI